MSFYFWECYHILRAIFKILKCVLASVNTLLFSAHTRLRKVTGDLTAGADLSVFFGLFCCEIEVLS